MDYISACPILAQEQYITRHDSVCAPLQFTTCREKGPKLDNTTLVSACNITESASENWQNHP